MSTSVEGPIPRLRSESRPCASTCTPPTRVASAAPVHRLPVVLPVVAGGSLPGVAFRHSTVGTFREHAAGDSIFLHPFAPPALPEFLATMGALTPAGRPYRFTPARAVRNATQVSLFHALYRPTLPSPTTPRRPARMVWFDHAGLPEDAPVRSASSPWGDRCVSWASPFTSRLATTTGRIAFVILRTSRSPPVALHLASRRRSYVRLRGSDLTSARTCTSRIQDTCKRTSPIFRTPTANARG
jgi:hypothetical protein